MICFDLSAVSVSILLFALLYWIIVAVSWALALLWCSVELVKEQFK